MRLFFVIILIFNLNLLIAKEIIVKPENSKNLQNILNSMSKGDVLIFKKGIYPISNLTLSNSFTELKGEKGAILDGQNKAQLLTIKSNSIKVNGITFVNTGSSSMHDYSAIKIDRSDFIEIKNNIFENNYFSIYLSGSKNCKIINNKIVGNNSKETKSGNGIHLWKCDSVQIVQNFISGCRDGIYFEFVKNSSIKSNYSTKNIRYGLHFMFSDGNEYNNNVFKNNGSGVAVMYTKNIKMQNNKFVDNWGSASYGLLLKDINQSVIVGNYFSNNTSGIFMEGSNNLHIHNNKFHENGIAIKILGNCYNDSILTNNFSGNTFDVFTNSSGNMNYFNQNYWDKYKGYDLDENKIGDIPYRPVSMFSMLVAELPISIILLHSFLVDLFDSLEKTIPSVIPETLIDTQPLMKPVNDRDIKS